MDKPRRLLIVNADDFGLSPGVNRGIALCHERGIVTSASLMVRGRAAEEAAEMARLHPALSIGLHIDLCEWTCKEEGWVEVYSVVALEDRVAVGLEVVRQLERFRELLGRDPTHIDSHQHVHRHEPVLSAARELADKLGVPLRQFHPRVRYVGDFYGQCENGTPYPEGVTVAGLLRILAKLEVGVSELGCHPGLDNDINSMYGGQRNEEVATLCDPRVRAALAAEGIELATFASVSPRLRLMHP